MEKFIILDIDYNIAFNLKILNYYESSFFKSLY